jgi:ABC-type Fe3+-siderophore transport system permease subunit
LLLLLVMLLLLGEELATLVCGHGVAKSCGCSVCVWQNWLR